MKEYTVKSDYMSFPIGTILGLTPKQAAKRAHLLKEVDKGIFRVEKETGFKCGETVMLDTDAIQIKGRKVKAAPSKASEVKEATEGQDSEAQDAQDDTGDAGAGSDTDNDGQSLDEILAGMDKGQLKEALDYRKEKYHYLSGEGKLRAQLKAVMEKEFAEKADAQGE